MAFKTDESFLEKLTMGAVGARRVAEWLTENDHNVIELERYTTSNKIWTIKVKRLRLPDLLCLRCGRRIESRAKTKLEIKLSDSPTVPGREWDANLRDDDLVGLVACRSRGDEVVASRRVALFTVGALRESVSRSRLGPPKSASEGAERDRTWPSTAPLRAGQVVSIDGQRVQVVLAEGGMYTFHLAENRPFVYLNVGEALGFGEVLLTGSVRGVTSIECEGDTWNPEAGLYSDNPIDVYAAIKALGLTGSQGHVPDLRALAEGHEDERIRLEALGALARLDNPNAVALLHGRAISRDDPLDLAMESVLILSELLSDEAAKALVAVASSTDLNDELRAAAVWGLGTTGMGRSLDLIPFLGDESDLVAVHALVAAGVQLGSAEVDAVTALLEEPDRRAGAASLLLSRQGPAGVSALLRAAQHASEHAKPWALYGLGLVGRRLVETVVGTQRANELARQLEPIWRGSQSWVSQAEIVKLTNFIERQSAAAPLVKGTQDAK